ncbi:MAG: 3-oxoacyl-[acyl-carrier-protein] reductase FabG [Verrucomicrobiota bacterium]|jgi:NAD(P)-dependent dehydrogenase (short-subunit alcohol dehydrogenase family)
MSDTPRTWFITGCSSGFGRSIAEAALIAGDQVIATARNIADLEMLEHVGAGRCHALVLDVTDAAQVQKVIQAAVQITGRLDVIVNNAGYGLIGAIEECGDEQIRRNFETNFFGALQVIRSALPILRSQKSGHIINISAAAAISNYPGFGIYGAAKAALEAMSESLRMEVLTHGIKVTLVQPGPFRTSFIAKGIDHAKPMPEYAGSSGKFAAFLKQMDGKQPGDPDRAAALIIKMVREEKSPQRFPLGKYVVKKIRDTANNRIRELEAWEQAAAETDGV